MTESYLMSLAQNAVLLALILAGPVLIISLLIGLLVSMVQAATQINEVTMTFIPKAVGIIAVIAVLGSWMLQKMMIFTSNLFASLPDLVH
jgi:flagellar biosynthetic protein FliQ